MSNIANQLVAVAATLLGFVAHDALSERQATETAAANIAVTQAIAPVVTRSIDLDGISFGNTLEISARAEREGLRAPAPRVSAATAPAHLEVATAETELADIRSNSARSVAPAQQVGLNALR
jgi:hypothetical protein